MLSTYDKLLRSSIIADDSEAIVALLEPRIANDLATESECLLCGVLLMSPPFLDEAGALRIFNNLMDGPRCFEAAVWAGYAFGVLALEVGRDFEYVLKENTQSTVAAHVLSLVSSMDENYSLAINENKRSRSLQLFYFNIIEGLRIDPDMRKSEKERLWGIACDLIIDKSV